MSIISVKVSVKASVIIPVYNSEEAISGTIEAISSQEFDDFEIISVDDGSTDGSLQILKGLEDKIRNLRVISQKNKGPAAARNYGAKEASGEIIVFTDSDCVPEKNWLKEMVKPFEDKEVVGVQGKYKNLNTGNTVSVFTQSEIEERYLRMGSQKYTDFIGSYSAAYRKSVFLDVNGFDESFLKASGEDPELSYRIAAKGHKMVFNEKAIVGHPHPTSIKNYIKQKFSRGYWGVLLYKKHPSKMGGQSYNSSLYFIHIAFTMMFLFLSAILLPFNLSASLGLLGVLILTTLPSSLRSFRGPKLLKISWDVFTFIRFFNGINFWI